ncbi:MAG: PAS domain S-box protein [Mariprofundus sp.]
MPNRFSLAHLGIMVGILYWPAEALIHDFILGQGSFLDNLFNADPNEIWMRTLISGMFIGFGFYAGKAVVHQQQLQERLRKKGERLHQIIDCTYDAYVSMDKDGLITGWNRSAEALFGWSVNQITGKSIDVIIPEHLRDAHHHGMRRYQQRSIGPWLYKPVRTQALHQDGFEFSIEMVVTPIKSDGDEEFFAFIREHES